MPTIRTILPQKKEEEKKLLCVAAYCRVSSDSDDQMHSFAAQTQYYKKLIGENPLWTLADIYADEGITGTSMNHRDEFKRMIADCKKGKIDRVLTKSVSRFARNTTDCLATVRLLTGLGVSVLFEKENIDTAAMSSEVLLAMMSMQAQDESASISGNMLWSYEKRMKNGTFVGTKAPYPMPLVPAGCSASGSVCCGSASAVSSDCGGTSSPASTGESAGKSSVGSSPEDPRPAKSSGCSSGLISSRYV